MTQLVQAPDWLTRDFLKTCLESDHKRFPEIQVVDFSVESALPPGNNYGSLMLRTMIRYKVPSRSEGEEVISLIVKAPISGGFADLTPEFYEQAIETEPKYYNEFITETYKLKDHDIVPRCYTSPLRKCVVMEDLKAKGFMMVDRRQLLDYDHCVLFANASSKLHALSIAMQKIKPGLIESLGMQDGKLKDSVDKVMKVMTSNSLRCMVAYLEDQPSYKEFLEVFKVLAENDNLWRMNNEVQEEKRPLMTVTQGDPWCTNMMFRYDSVGKVKAIKILDFQFLKFSSPVVEFTTFLWMSANIEVKQFHINDLFKIYNDSLNATLSELGCSERLPYEELMSEVKTLSPIVFMVTGCMVPGAIADEELDMTALSESAQNTHPKDSVCWKYFQGKSFNNNFPKVFDIIKNDGYLDDMVTRIGKIDQIK